jgi:ParB family transcriptional regulator, chromosome partitioning protein
MHFYQRPGARTKKKQKPLKWQMLFQTHFSQEKGVIQPILVRPMGSKFELIAGERRWRAAQNLKLEDIPAIVRDDLDDATSLEISIIENVQREDLNPIEEANAYQALISRFEYTLEKVGQMMGKDKTTISNSLRLLILPEEVRVFVEDGSITSGHAKALLSLTDAKKRKLVAQMVMKKGMSVRETEKMVRKINNPTKREKQVRDPEIV